MREPFQCSALGRRNHGGHHLREQTVAFHATKRSSCNTDAIFFKSKHLGVAQKASVCSRDTALRQPAAQRYVLLSRTIRIGHLEVVAHPVDDGVQCKPSRGSPRGGLISLTESDS